MLGFESGELVFHLQELYVVRHHGSGLTLLDTQFTHTATSTVSISFQTVVALFADARVEDSDASSPVTGHGTLQPVVVHHSDVGEQLHVHIPGATLQPLGQRVDQGLVVHNVVDWLTIGLAQIDDLLVRNV